MIIDTINTVKNGNGEQAKDLLFLIFYINAIIILPYLYLDVLEIIAICLELISTV